MTRSPRPETIQKLRSALAMALWASAHAAILGSQNLPQIIDPEKLADKYRRLSADLRASFEKSADMFLDVAIQRVLEDLEKL